MHGVILKDGNFIGIGIFLSICLILCENTTSDASFLHLIMVGFFMTMSGSKHFKFHNIREFF